MAKITPTALIGKFKYALEHDVGYIYGKTWEMWSAEKQAEYLRTYQSNPTKYAERKNSAENGGKWAGHIVTDCSGLFAWAFKQLSGTMYHGSNTMYREWCAAKGTLKSGKRTDGKTLLPGTAVFTGTEGSHGHVGLYIGNGTVIEAQGTNAGVTTSKITNSKWTYWGELKGVNYEGGETVTDNSAGNTGTNSAATATPEKGYAIVTGKQVALRRGPSTSAAVVTRIATGTSVKIATPPDGWEYVEVGGKAGYMMKEFLREG